MEEKHILQILASKILEVHLKKIKNVQLICGSYPKLVEKFCKIFDLEAMRK